MKSMNNSQLLSALDYQNIFLLRSQTKEGLSNQIAIDYSPAFCEALECKQNTVPIFNNDAEPSQPGFILQVDKPFHFAQSEVYQTQFKKKLEETKQKSGLLLVPKPKGSNVYCNVCKESTSDYLQHSESKGHKLKFKKNRFFSKISTIAEEFKKEQSGHQTALDLQPQTLGCGLMTYSPFDDSNDHHESTQCELPTVKKVKVDQAKSISSILASHCVQTQSKLSPLTSFTDMCKQQYL